MKKFTHLTWKNIRDYLEGKLSAQEMHQIEKHLQECELCNQAVEGFEESNLQKSEVIIAQINRKLGKKLGKKNTQKSNLQKVGYWVGAASVVVGAGLFFLKKQNHDLVTNSQNISLLDEKVQETPMPTVFLSEEKLEGITESTQAQSQDNNVTKKESTKNESQKNEKILIQEKKQKGLDESQEQKIKVEEQKAKIQQQRAFTEEKSQESSDTGDDDTSITDNLAVSEPEPIIGHQAFRRYLDENLKYPTQSLKKAVSGEVIVAFEVMPDSSLRSFTIVKGLDQATEQEAIRLIKNGSLWKPAQKGQESIIRKTQVSIFFKAPKKLETEEH